MKGIRTTIIALTVAAAAALALSGCATGYDDHHEQIDQKSPVYFVNTETGRVTKYIDYTYDYDEDGKVVESEDVLFNEGYTKEDTKVEYPSFATGPHSGGSSTLSTTVDINDKPYPMRSSFYWDILPMNTVDQIEYYNEQLANPDLLADGTLANSTLGSLVRTDIDDTLTSALKDTPLPAIQFAITGHSDTTADTRYVTSWKAGDPAWLALQKVQGSPVTSSTYNYTFLCATYDVKVANADTIMAAAKALPKADLVQFTLSNQQSSLLVETDEPCGVDALDLEPKNWDQSVPTPENVNPSSGYNNGDVDNPWG